MVLDMIGFLVIGLIAALWYALYIRSRDTLVQLQENFANLTKKDQKKTLRKFRRNRYFYWFTKTRSQYFAMSLCALIFGAFTGTSLIPLFLLILYWWLTNGKRKKPVDLELKKFDEWIIQANQTTFN